MASKPLYAINDIIYLIESAKLGFIESYRITGIEFNTNYSIWSYKCAISHKGPEPYTVIDKYNLRRSETLEFTENQLCSAKSAIELAIINTKQRLRYLESLLSTRYPESEDGTNNDN